MQYKTYLNLTAFIILFTICFVYLFQKKTEMTSFVVMFIFQIFFLLFVAQTISTFDVEEMNYLTFVLWGSMFAGVSLKFVSLILILIMFNHYNANYSIKKNINIELSPQNRKMMNEFKLMFVIGQAFIIYIILFALLYCNRINSHTTTTIYKYLSYSSYNNFKPLIEPLIYVLMMATILGISSYEVYIGSKFSKMSKYQIASQVTLKKTK